MQSNPPGKPPSVSEKFFNVWRALTVSPTASSSPEIRLQTLVLAGFLLVLIILSFIGMIVNFYVIPSLPLVVKYISPVVFFCCLALFLANRMGYFQQVKIITLALFISIPILALLENGDYSSGRLKTVFPWLLVAIELGSVLLSFAGMLWLIAINIFIIILLAFFIPQIGTTDALFSIGYIVSISSLVLINRFYRIEVEKGHQAEILSANRDLQNLQETLEQRVAERTKELLDLKEQYRALAENNPQQIIRLDRDCRILYLNPAVAQAANQPAGQMVGKSLQEIFNDPYLVASIQEKIEQTFATGQPAKNEIEIGGRYYEWWLAPERDANGRLVSVISSSLDITERKRSEDALHASELRFRAMNDTSPFGLFIDDPEGNVIYFNQMYLLVTGISAEEAKMGKWRDIIHPDDRERVFKMRKEALSAPPYRFDSVHRYLREDGRTVWVSSKTQAMWDGDQLIGYFGLIEDITARIEEITARIVSDEALRNRTEELEKAVKDLEGFSYTVSHDLRAPLRAIDGYSRLLQSEIIASASADTAFYLKNIRDNAQRMGRLIDELLAFARLGRSTPGLSPVNMRDLVQSVIDSLHHETIGKEVEISTSELPDCQGDVAMLRQVWVNLIANAIKFSGKVEHPRIEIGRQIDESGMVIYFVQDNGVGFDMAHSGKLFGVFQRLHSFEEFEGTGVGLAIVDRIVQKHGGRIWAKSALGAGATFYFTIPPKIPGQPE